MEENNIETFEIPLTGKFSAVEETVLDYLYTHPGGDFGTRDLMRILKPEQSTIEEQQQAYEEAQDGIETLIVAKLVRGKRVAESGNIYHDKLRLTPKGEAEAIKERRRDKKMTVSVPAGIPWLPKLPK